MKYKINKHIQCEANVYNDRTGESFCILHTDIGNFGGHTKLKEEDEEYRSKFLGCQIAEYKAYVGYLKEKRKILNYQIKTLDSLSKSIKNNANGKDTSIADKEIYFLKWQYQKEKEKISTMLASDSKIKNWFKETKEIKAKLKKKIRTQ